MQFYTCILIKFNKIFLDKTRHFVYNMGEKGANFFEKWRILADQYMRFYTPKLTPKRTP